MEKIKTYKIEPVSSWDEYTDKITRSYKGWAFRGQADSSWPLMSTLGRYLNTYVKKEHWDAQEKRILRIFQRKSHLFLSHIPERTDTFQWLALMQHHGAPTRLLDFTWSPYVAAFFALERATTTASVWAINPKRLVNVTEQLNEFLKVKTRYKLASAVVNIAVGIGEPFIMNNRLIAQSGTFVVTRQPGLSVENIVGGNNYPEDTLVQFNLPANLVRPAGMQALFMMNITNATLFPDLDGLAKSLAYELEFHYAYDPRKI